MVENLRQLERDLYLVHKELAEDPHSEEYVYSTIIISLCF